MLRATFVCFVAAALLSVAARSSAQEGEALADDLSELRELVLHARYEEVGPRLEAYLASPERSAAERVAALDLRAMVLVAERADEAAHAALTELYRRDPGHVPSDPEASPVVLEAFEQAQASAGQGLPVAVEITPWQPLGDGLPPLELRVTAHADAVHTLTLFHRVGPGPFVEQVLDIAADGSARTRLPVERAQLDQELGYYVVAQAPSGHVLLSLGSEASPRSLIVPATAAVGGGEETPSTSIVEKWWFWTLLGVVVVGAGVGIGVAVSGDESAPNGSLGSGVLR